MSEEEQTRVTSVGPAKVESPGGKPGTDCIVVIYTKQPTLLGKRFVLDTSPTKVGRGADNEIVLDGDSVSRRHAHFEKRAQDWMLIDLGSTNGTYCNDEQIAHDVTLKNGDRVKVGPTIFKFLSGADVEAQYHEEIYRLTIMDGLTQIYNARYLYEALEREIIRGRRHERDLSIVMFDIDHFKRINDSMGHAAGDEVLKEVSRRLKMDLRPYDVVGRYGGEEFLIILPGCELAVGARRADEIRNLVAKDPICTPLGTTSATVSMGVTVTSPGRDHSVSDLLHEADVSMYAAKKNGRNRVELFSATARQAGAGQS